MLHEQGSSGLGRSVEGVSARVPKGLVRQLEKEADEAGVSRSAFVSELIREATRAKRPVPGPLTPLSALGPVNRKNSADRARFLLDQISTVVSELEAQDLEGAGMIVSGLVTACEGWFSQRSTPVNQINELLLRVADIADARNTPDERKEAYQLVLDWAAMKYLPYSSETGNESNA